MNINGSTKLYGLIGNPIEHTLSPLLHNSLAEMMGHNMVYAAYPVLSANVSAAISGAYALGISGMNITAPYKEDVIPCLKEIMPEARQLGSVNTIVRSDGGFIGYNTDNTGLYRAMQSEGIEISGADIIILGAGAAARAAAFLCVGKGARRVFILNRSYDKAQDMADYVNNETKTTCLYSVDINDLSKLPEKCIALQCTSLGIKPNEGRVLIDCPDFYRRIEAGVDMIYNPCETAFMENIKKAGGRAINGLKMLLYQGITAYELWHQTTVPKEYAEIIYKKLQAATTAFILIGFMGSGKTTVGNLLAGYLQCKMTDTDKQIESQQKISVTDIFASYGEEYFRDLETEYIMSLLNKINGVIATGGGLVLRETNRLLLKKIGKVIYLKTTAKAIAGRIKNDGSRPLLNTSDMYNRINEILNERDAIYSRTADIIIETSYLEPEQVVDEIIRLI